MSRRNKRVVVAALGTVLTLVLGACNIRITDGNATSRGSDISGDGRYVAFSSYASNLVPGDTNGHEDVFVWDRETSTTVQVTHGNGDSYDPAISADGRYVAFTSRASDLVPVDPTPWDDIFVWDRVTGTTIAISDGDSPETPSISADGRYVAYASWDSQLAPDDTPAIIDVFVWDRDTGTTTRITDDPVMHSQRPAISGDGGHVAYSTELPYRLEDPPYPVHDVFVHDRGTGVTTQVTDGNWHSIDPDISDDGRYVTFTSRATDLGPPDPNGNLPDAYLWDATTGVITRVSGDHSTGDVAISGDGSHVAYTSGEAFVWDRTTGTTIQTTNGSGTCHSVKSSDDGRYLTYRCSHPDLVNGDTNGVPDIFVWDRLRWPQPAS